MFNLLKLTYHFQDIFIYDELRSVLSEKDFFSVIKMVPSNFHDHLKWQDQHYRVPKKGDFNTRHMFYVSGLNQGLHPTMLTKQDDKESPVLEDSLLYTSSNSKAKKLNPLERVIEINRMEKDLEVLQTNTPESNKSRRTMEEVVTSSSKVFKTNHLPKTIK